MKLQNVRTYFTKNSTIGKLFIDGVDSGILILEPTDLGLDDTMTEAVIKSTKADHYAKAKEYVAIPTGKAYKLGMCAPAAEFLARFPLFVQKGIKQIPLFSGIKGYGGVLIHPGTIEIATHQQSEGCQMPALKLGETPDTTAQSNEAWLELMAKIETEIKAANCTYEPVRDVAAYQAFNK